MVNYGKINLEKLKKLKKDTEQRINESFDPLIVKQEIHNLKAIIDIIEYYSSSI